MPSPVAETLLALASALDGLGVSWYLFGAQAALARGSHRLTEDIDVTVMLGDLSAEAIQASVAAAGFALRVADIDDFVTTTRVLPFVHETTRMPVDIVLGGPGLEELFLQESERLLVGDVSVPVPSVEHLIVMKLLAGRPNDLIDAAAMARGNEVDLDAIEQLATLIADSIGEGDILTTFAQLRRDLVKRKR
jgi:predicted nucleotidyltransferase